MTGFQVDFPVRVFCPSGGWLGTALSQDSVGVVVVRDGDDAPQYCPRIALLEVMREDEGLAELEGGKVMLYGTTELPGNEEENDA